MSAWTNGTYTKRGLALLSKLTQGSSLKITKAVLGTGYVNPTELANQTSVSGSRQNLLFKPESYPENGVCKLPMFVTNEGLTSGYIAKQIGLYAMDPDLGEILFFISQSEHGTEIPSESIMPDYSAVWSFYFRYGQADNVSVTVDPSHTITEDMLNEVRVIAETGVSAPKVGKAIALENTANLPLVNLRIFGKTTQNGTPSIYNPVALENVGVTKYGNFHYEVSGKNLLDPSIATETTHGVSRRKNDDGSITIDGTATETHGLGLGQISLYDGTYILTGGMTGSHLTVWGRKVSNGEFVNVVTDSGSGATFIADSKAYNSYLIQYHIAGGTKFNNRTLYPMVRIEAFKDASYEKYKTPKRHSIYVPNGLAGIPVSSGGNYTDENGQQWICDEVDLARGVLIQRIKSVVLNESSVWQKNTEESDSYLYFVRTEDELGSAVVICDKLQNKSLNTLMLKNVSAENEGIQGGVLSTQKDVIYINLCTRLTENTVDGLKTFLKNNRLTVRYALADPVETPLQGGEVDIFNALKSNNPNTTIINEIGATMEADCFLAQHEAAFKRIIRDSKGREELGRTLVDYTTMGNIGDTSDGYKSVALSDEFLSTVVRNATSVDIIAANTVFRCFIAYSEEENFYTLMTYDLNPDVIFVNFMGAGQLAVSPRVANLFSPGTSMAFYR